MKAFDAGVVPWIAFSRIRSFHSFCLVFVSSLVYCTPDRCGSPMTFDSSSSFCYFYNTPELLRFHISSHHHPTIFSEYQIHQLSDRQSFLCPDIGDIGYTHHCRIFWIELFFQKIVEVSIISFRYGRFILCFRYFGLYWLLS